MFDHVSYPAEIESERGRVVRRFTAFVDFLTLSRRRLLPVARLRDAPLERRLNHRFLRRARAIRRDGPLRRGEIGQLKGRLSQRALRLRFDVRSLRRHDGDRLVEHRLSLPRVHGGAQSRARRRRRRRRRVDRARDARRRSRRRNRRRRRPASTRERDDRARRDAERDDRRRPGVDRASVPSRSSQQRIALARLRHRDGRRRGVAIRVTRRSGGQRPQAGQNARHVCKRIGLNGTKYTENKTRFHTRCTR